MKLSSGPQRWTVLSQKKGRWRNQRKIEEASKGNGKVRREAAAVSFWQSPHWPQTRCQKGQKKRTEEVASRHSLKCSRVYRKQLQRGKEKLHPSPRHSTDGMSFTLRRDGATNFHLKAPNPILSSPFGAQASSPAPLVISRLQAAWGQGLVRNWNQPVLAENRGLHQPSRTATAARCVLHSWPQPFFPLLM